MWSNARRATAFRRLKFVILIAVIFGSVAMSALSWINSDPEFSEFAAPYSLTSLDVSDLPFAVAQRRESIYARAKKLTPMSSIMEGRNGPSIDEISEDQINEYRVRRNLSDEVSRRNIELSILDERIEKYTQYASNYGTPWVRAAKRSLVILVGPIAAVALLLWAISSPIPRFLSWVSGQDVS